MCVKVKEGFVCDFSGRKVKVLEMECGKQICSHVFDCHGKKQEPPDGCDYYKNYNHLTKKEIETLDFSALSFSWPAL